VTVQKFPGSWSPHRLIPNSTREYISPCGGFKLAVSRYEQKTDADSNNYWDYSAGVVTKIIERPPEMSDQSYTWATEITKIQRNYGAFPFAWFTYNEQTYLVYGVHYQHYGILNCHTRERWDYTSRDGYCHAEWKWDAEKPTEIVGIGCFWGGPYTRRTYDITNPQLFPWEVKSEVSDDDEDNEE